MGKAEKPGSKAHLRILSDLKLNCETRVSIIAFVPFILLSFGTFEIGLPPSFPPCPTPSDRH